MGVMVIYWFVNNEVADFMISDMTSHYSQSFNTSTLLCGSYLSLQYTCRHTHVRTLEMYLFCASYTVKQINTIFTVPAKSCQ